MGMSNGGSDVRKLPEKMGIIRRMAVVLATILVVLMTEDPCPSESLKRQMREVDRRLIEAVEVTPDGEINLVSFGERRRRESEERESED